MKFRNEEEARAWVQFAARQATNLGMADAFIEDYRERCDGLLGRLDGDEYDDRDPANYCQHEDCTTDPHWCEEHVREMCIEARLEGARMADRLEGLSKAEALTALVERDLEVGHCVHCGKIWILSGNSGPLTCSCDAELYPCTRKLEPGELLLADEFLAMVFVEEGMGAKTRKDVHERILRDQAKRSEEAARNLAERVKVLEAEYQKLRKESESFRIQRDNVRKELDGVRTELTTCREALEARRRLP